MEIHEFLKDNEFINYIGLELVSIDTDTAVARFPFDSKLFNPYGTIHGGILYSAADIVCGSLACMCGVYCTTVSGSINYVAPGVADEYVYIEAKIIKSGGHMVFVDCVIKSDAGKVLDTGVFTFFKTDAKA